MCKKRRQRRRPGFRPRDEILTLAGQPIISIADVQWVLHTTKAPAEVKAEVLRNDEKIDLTLKLEDGWRRSSDISWRTTTWDLRRMALGGLVLEVLPAEARQAASLDAENMALRVKHVGQYGDHGVAKRAGFEKDDIITSFDGMAHHMTESEIGRTCVRRTNARHPCSCDRYSGRPADDA